MRVLDRPSEEEEEGNRTMDKAEELLQDLCSALTNTMQDHNVLPELIKLTVLLDCGCAMEITGSNFGSHIAYDAQLTTLDKLLDDHADQAGH